MTIVDKERFLVYADFLGTKNRHKTPNLVIQGRELFERTLNSCVVPLVVNHDIHLNVFSDTAILTCEELSPLLTPLADLFAHFLGLEDLGLQEKTTDASTVLWLRAGISYGKAMSMDDLHNTEQIRTCHILDTSIPSAYRMEGIRPGSRVYVDPDIPDGVFGEFGKSFFKWQHITGGHGSTYIPNVREYLWPAKHYKGDKLPRMTQKLHAWWMGELSTRDWPGRDYDEKKMIHLDETLKLFIRTCSIFCPEPTRREILFSLLPDSEDDQRHLEFKWGVWFQALRGIAEYCDMVPSLRTEFESAFGRVWTILRKNELYKFFLTELTYPDYAPFKEKLCEMGLCESL